jgi:transketolase
MRRAFVHSLHELADQDPRVIFLTGDLGYEMFDEFKAKHGARYVNVGIAEAQLVSAAAGLAREGFRPIVYSIASFMTARPFEQIRVDVAYPHLPVIIIGAGGGYCYSSSGVTHHAAEDLSLMSMLPGMTVVAPGDPNEVSALLPQLLRQDGPAYIRLGKFGEPACPSESPVVLGQARVLRGGRRIALATTADLATLVLGVADELLKERIIAGVFHFHTIKPLDTETLDRFSRGLETMIIVEEAIPSGGLASAVMAWKESRGSAMKLVRLGPPDAFALGSWNRETLRDRFSYGPAAIREACRRAWRGEPA